MKTNRREKQMKRLAALAVMLGIFSPLAEAAISEKEGLSLEDLNKVVKSLEIQQHGDTVVFAGIMPKACAENATVSYDHRNGRHLTTIKMPNFPKCEEDFRALPDSEKTAQKIDAADVLSEIKLKDLSGNLFLRHYKEGSRLATDRIQDDELKNTDGEIIAHKGKDERSKEEQARKDREAAALQNKQRAELHLRAIKFCQAGDFAGLGNEIMAASDLLGDVSGMLEKLNLAQKDKLKKDLAKAATAEEAKLAYDGFLEAALLNGWDEDELKEAYIEKRFEILNTAAEDAKSGETKLASVDKDIREWMTDLRTLDGREYRKKKEKFADIYAEIGTHAANNKKPGEAEKYYDKAKRLSDLDGKIKLDGAMSKIYAEQFKECVKKSPTKMEACEKKYMSKAKNRANSIKDALGRKGGDEAAQELAAFQEEYIGTFGAGMTMNYNGFGTMSQMPGAVEQFKRQALQEYMQQQQMQQMQRMYGGAAMGATAATPASSFLGIR